MKKYYYLGWHLFIMTFVFYLVPSVMQRDFVYVSENANNLLWMANGLAAAMGLWFYVLTIHRIRKYFGKNQEGE